VPTPLDRDRNPDLSFVVGTADTIAANLRAGQLVCLESTTYPGTTAEILKPKFEAAGLRVGTEIFLAYSPEREDPGNRHFETRSIPKVVGADDPASLKLACQLYSSAIQKIVPVSNSRTAEAVKITENVYRAVNIALVNELKLVYDAMGIDVWEVIDAAKTKPFGYSPFYPGPGLGGHCVPIDPFYLTWKAREFGVQSRFIELSGIINRSMPDHVISRLAAALKERSGIRLGDARILIVGAAYKKNVDDTRESPALFIMEMLEQAGARVEYHDPHVPSIPPTREHPGLTGRSSVPLTPESLHEFHAAMICVDHDAVDWRMLIENVPLVIDTRNVATARGLAAGHIVKA
jgi:UDP-N-acetyl-D-glucosamine dehydrogenase